MKLRIVLHSDTNSFPNRWLIQKKKLFGDWKFYDGYFSSKGNAEAFLEALRTRKFEIVGETTNCITTGLKGVVGCGTVLKEDKLVTAKHASSFTIPFTRNYLGLKGCFGRWEDYMGIEYFNFDEPLIIDKA